MKTNNIAYEIYQFFIHQGADGQTFEESCKLLKEIVNMFGAEIK